MKLPEKSLMNVQEAADYAGDDVSEKAIRKLLEDPDFYPKIKIGKRVFVHREMFDQWMKEQASPKKVSGF
jgi:hypothetical protein